LRGCAVLLAHLVEQLAPDHGDVPGGADAQPNLVALDCEQNHLDIVADAYHLSSPPR
jgi:hypothetical protein